MLVDSVKFAVYPNFASQELFILKLDHRISGPLTSNRSPSTTSFLQTNGLTIMPGSADNMGQYSFEIRPRARRRALPHHRTPTHVGRLPVGPDPLEGIKDR